MHAAKEQIPSFSDAVKLLRVWANQRGYSSSSSDADKLGSVVGFENSGSWWGFFIAYLVWGDDNSNSGADGKKRKTRKRIGMGLSSYQLFRAVLDLLGECDDKLSIARR